MKRLSTLIITIALVLGLTQCKKNVETITTPTGSVGEPVYISFNVGSGDKHIVYPGTGAVVYTEGDKIYVGNHGKYIGTLKYANGTFSGTIYGPQTTDYLHFYFVGGLETGTITEGTTTSFNVNIANQSISLPVLSYGRSTQKYVDGTTTYECTLENKCGLVKFVLSTDDDSAITISGMKTIATIDFANPGITPTDDTGEITLCTYYSSCIKWAILLPQDEVEKPIVNSTDYEYIVENIPAVTVNMLYSTGVHMTAYPIGGKPGLFTINSDNDQVYFSQGNMQYQASSNTWRFANEQYDYIGSDNSNISSTYSGWIDLFGWGTSGYNHRAHCYQPWSTSKESSYYYAYDDIAKNLYDDSGLADWGVYNPISNGYNIANKWRTLTQPEWNYLINTRSTNSGIRYAKATVCNVKGVLLLPDNWNSSVCSLVSTNTQNASFGSNQITEAQWTMLEEAGVVFLPLAAMRYGIDVIQLDQRTAYWSSTSYHDNEESGGAYTLNFYEDDLITDSRGINYFGFSVRLVRDAH